MKNHSCDGNPSLTNYGRGCRCDLCRAAKSLYERELRTRNKKARPSKPKKPAGKRDSPFVLDDAFTREQILAARKEESV
jgi:hypothetical protein